MKKKWFSAKTYGYGWTPATWQEWGILLLFLFFVLWNFIRIDSHSHSASDTLITFIPQTASATLVLLVIGFLTREKPQWSWRKKKKK